MSDPAEEAERRQQKRDLEAAARHGDLDDPVRLVRIHFAGTPPRDYLYGICRWSLAARLVSDASEAGAAGGTVTDLAPMPDWVPDPGPKALLRIGAIAGGRWQWVTKGYEQLVRAIPGIERELS